VSEDAFPHGQGEDGMAPAAVVEVWCLEDGRVTFGGFPPRGDRAWRIQIWRAIAAEALCVAEEEEGSRAVGERASPQVTARM